MIKSIQNNLYNQILNVLKTIQIIQYFSFLYQKKYYFIKFILIIMDNYYIIKLNHLFQLYFRLLIKFILFKYPFK